MNKNLIILILIFSFIIFSSVVFAQDPPGTWPQGTNLWTMTEDDFYKTLDGFPSYKGYIKDARMGAISPDGKYMAYVYKGPYLVIREYTGDEKRVAKIPWGVKPVWSDDSKTLYFTKLQEVNDDLRHYWYRYTQNIYSVSVEDEFDKISLLSDLKAYPTDYDSSVNELLITWVRPEDHEYRIVTMDMSDFETYDTEVFARDAIAAPEGKELAMAKIATPLFFTDPYEEIYVESLYVDYGSVYFEEGDKYLVPNDYSKGGDYFIVSRLFAYKRKSSADPVKKYYGMYAINRQTGEVQEFLSNYFGNFEANFREGTNELVFTSRLSW